MKILLILEEAQKNMENPIVVEYNGKKYSRAETIIALKLYDDFKSGKLVAKLMEALDNE